MAAYMKKFKKTVLLSLDHTLSYLFNDMPTKYSSQRCKNTKRINQFRHFRSQTNVFKNATSNMSKQSYWEEFYHKKRLEASGSYDWFFPYAVAKPWLRYYIAQQAKQITTNSKNTSREQFSLQVMDLGCGTSDLATQLFTDDPTLQIHCIDFSAEAVRNMQATLGHLRPQKESNPGITFLQCDASSLPFANHKFNICYEKGTVDAVLKQRTLGTSKAVRVICETVRVIKPSGLFVQFSDEPPELRLPILEMAKGEFKKSQNINVSISFKEIGHFSGIEYFLYVMQMQDSRTNTV